MTVVGLILFVSVFAMIVFRAVTKPKGEIEEMERLALENDNLVPKEEHK
jgi:hypothetical protein